MTALFVGIVINYLKEKEDKNLFVFNYSKEDSLFLNSNIDTNVFYEKLDNKKVDYKQELLDFSTDNLTKKIDVDTNYRLININKANLSELVKLPGIGEKTATEILNYRNRNGEFRSIKDLMKVKGIGKAKFNKIKNMITVN
ncbi:MAG: ComEA family DNA-binding protein [Melioribacter sp.]|nr:ComEA family DNA-binding protein [Melioribacter sp.]